MQADLLVMHLEGTHRESFALHREAVRRCVQLRGVVSLGQAYQAAMQAKDKLHVDRISIGTYRRVVELLAQAGRVKQVEQVLADCYSSHVRWSVTKLRNLEVPIIKWGPCTWIKRLPKSSSSLFA